MESKYFLKPRYYLPESGTCLVNDEHESYALQLELLKRGLRWLSPNGDTPLYLTAKIIFWNPGTELTYSDNAGYWVKEVNVDFSRYFAVIPGFEGYHHGKQYGI